MSLDLHVRGQRFRDRPAPALSLENDGYYWFLQPLFARLRDECGKSLDLYGDTQFTRDDFPRLRALLHEAERLARRQPRTWEVHLGTQLRPAKREVRRTVDRDRLLELIAAFRALVDAADELGGTLECIGD